MSKFNLLYGLSEGLKPTSLMTVDEWAEANRIMHKSASYYGGKLYSCRIAPYARKIMQCLSPFSGYSDVIVAKSAQSGITELALNLIGHKIDLDPCPILYVAPTNSLLNKLSTERIDGMIETCESLRDKVSKKKSRDGSNTITKKTFINGVLYLGSAESPSDMKSISVRVVILDELDEYPIDLQGQGSASAMAEVRTQMWPNRLKFKLSTPTSIESSQIWKEFLATDQNYYNVPCPICGAMQTLVFEQLVWVPNKPKSVQYRCLHCGNEFQERKKEDMLMHGEWQPTVLQNVSSEKIGFHINALYAHHSLFKWSDVVREYEDAQRDPSKMKTFINTKQGLPTVEISDTPKWEYLYNRREEYQVNFVNKEVCFITAGVDIQKDRIELEIVGWGKDKQSWSIDYRVLLGSTNLPEVWSQLDKIIYETWEREDGIEMSIKLMAIDSGYNTTEVYSFCRNYSTTRVIAIKGRDKVDATIIPPKQIDQTRQGKKIGQTKVWGVGSSFIKHDIYAWLGLEMIDGIAPPCYMHFPQYDSNYFKGITAEDWMPAKKEWHKRFERNEPLDCRVYARAAAVVVGIDRLKPNQIEALCGTTRIKKEPVINTGSKRLREGSVWD